MLSQETKIKYISLYVMNINSLIHHMTTGVEPPQFESGAMEPNTPSRSRVDDHLASYATWQTSLPINAQSSFLSSSSSHLSFCTTAFSIAIMRYHISLVTLWITATVSQTYPECTAELARTDDCAAVINANACYNKFRWNSQTLTCIDGTDNTQKAKMVFALSLELNDMGLLIENSRCVNAVHV